MIETPADYRSFAFLGSKTPVCSLRSGSRSFAFYGRDHKGQAFRYKSSQKTPFSKTQKELPLVAFLTQENWRFLFRAFHFNPSRKSVPKRKFRFYTKHFPICL